MRKEEMLLDDSMDLLEEVDKINAEGEVLDSEVMEKEDFELTNRPKQKEIVTSDEELRKRVYTFYNHQMQSIENDFYHLNEQTAVKKAILKEILDKIALHDLEYRELIDAFKAISGDENTKINALSHRITSLLDIFKQPSNAPHPLMSPKVQTTDDDEKEKAISNLSSEDLNVMTEFFMRVTQEAVKKRKQQEEVEY